MYHGERFNGFSHLAGAILAAAGMAVLVTSSALHHDAWKVVSSVVYGTTLVLLYTISTLYHSLRGPAKGIFQRLD
ncbi:hemolysin III family protein, partial [Pandoraea pneumonica]